MSIAAAIAAFVALSAEKSAQGVTVYLENFNSFDAGFSSNGIFSNNWTVQNSSSEGGAKIVHDRLVLTNDAGGAAKEPFDTSKREYAFGKNLKTDRSNFRSVFE